MKPSLTSTITAALLVFATLPLCATPLDDLVAELKHAVEKEAAARANGPNNPNGFGNPGLNPAFIDAQIDQIISQAENPAYGNMEGQLAQITSMYTSTEVQEATTNLLHEIKKEREDKTAAELAELDSLMQRAGKALLLAKKPEDLDDVIAAMGEHGGNRYGGNPELQGNQQLVQEFSSALEFVKQYQNYLAHLAGGQTDAARNDLQMLSNNNGGDGLMPRSKILELENPNRLSPTPAPTTASVPTPSTPVAEAQAILDSMKTLDDLKPSIIKLSTTPLNDIQIQLFRNTLTEMESNYESITAGLPAQSSVNPDTNQGPFRLPAAIRREWYVLTLRASFDSYKGPPPGPNETPKDYIDRVIADAVSRQDFELLRQADAARKTVAPDPGGNRYNPYHTDGMDYLVAAWHQEEAGQFSLAVLSYQEALQSTDVAMPAKMIGDKLAAIQRDHPKEYADGMGLVVSPPMPRSYQLRPATPTSPNNPSLPFGGNMVPAPLLPPSPTAATNSAAMTPPPSPPAH